ncbi:MAG: helix-turn-helix transcriptional regulator [Euzebyaceae bacterium]|nr:helix-turn-helix transcriptional regulator [Euzebyaceae bacterium]
MAPAIELTPQRLRALTHPLRLKLLGALRLDGPSTATLLAERFGESSGATSYHLRQLARHGFVEEDSDRGNARDRWWRAAHRSTRWTPSRFVDDPADREAASWLLLQSVALQAGWLENWVRERSSWGREWLDAADDSDYRLRLTPERLAAMTAEIGEVIRRYQRDPVPGASDAEGVEPVTVLVHAFPQRQPAL